MEMKGEVYQFLSRSNILESSLGRLKICPIQRPDISITMDFQICDKPFEINFAHVIARKPCIGAHELIDSCMDKYMSKRWPKCIKGIATISSSASDLQEDRTLKSILHVLRQFLWEKSTIPEFGEFFNQSIDQKATTEGYRREYFGHQMFDFNGNRRPSSAETFVPTEIGAYVGPGVAHIPDVNHPHKVNELVWSWIIPFKDRINMTTDRPKLLKMISATATHFNSYSELEDARQHLGLGQIKACVRAAATSVDAILRVYCDYWGTKFPVEDIPFDQKIEIILGNAGHCQFNSALADWAA